MRYLVIGLDGVHNPVLHRRITDGQDLQEACYQATGYSARGYHFAPDWLTHVGFLPCQVQAYEAVHSAWAVLIGPCPESVETELLQEPVVLAYLTDGPTQADVEAAYDRATGSWWDACWTHPHVAVCHCADHGRYTPCPQCRDTLDADGDPVYCDGEQECQVCLDAKQAAALSEAYAYQAIVAMREGDFDAAARLGSKAAEAERDFGDAPTWGAFAALLCDMASTKLTG